jgi:glycosyltransferase involved in cell wall biosynthesis
MERAMRNRGHTVTYVGLPGIERQGYNGAMPIDQIAAHLSLSPDLYLWIDPGGRYFPTGIEELPIPTACYLIDVHLGRWRYQAARFFDAVFVAQKDHVDSYRQALGHDQVYWLPLAAASDVHRQHDLPRIYDVGFVGNIERGHRKTARRRRLKLIAERFRTNDFYRSYTPEEVGQIYSQSRIVFNTSIAGDVTMRVFEGAACGALVLTDSVDNGLDELFNIGSEIVTYSDDADLLGKIARYLAHDEKRERIARAGQRRVLAEHTYGHRVQRVVDKITCADFCRVAPMRTADAGQHWRARQRVYTHLHMLDALLDEARARGMGPLQRAWAIWPCLMRRLFL